MGKVKYKFKYSKQPAKVYTEAERKAFADSLGMNASDKPVTEIKTRVKKQKPIDLTHIPADLIESLGLKN